MNKSQLNFIERFSRVSEAMGLPRAAGKVLAWMMICDPPERSSDQLMKELGLSRGTISSMTRLLETMSHIETVSVPGSRRRLYRIREESFGGVFEDRLKWLAAIRDIATEGLEDIKPLSPFSQKKLEQLHEFYAFLVKRLPEIVAEMEQQKDL